MNSGKGIIADSKTKSVAFTGIMTALVTLATFLIQIPIPATKGYFNIGDSIVYVSGLLFGPYVGAFSGGVGSMLTDVLTYPIYAPGTLVIKGVEGFVVGILSQRLRLGTLKSKGRRILALTAVTTGSFLMLVAVSLLAVAYVAGSGQLPLWLSDYITDPTLWIAFSILVALVVGLVASYVVYRSDLIVLFMLIGGAFMVTGYFLYELALFGMAAIVEVPSNIVQVLSGIVIARPIYRGVSRAITV
jgi:uncharacterized membrane protein